MSAYAVLLEGIKLKKQIKRIISLVLITAVFITSLVIPTGAAAAPQAKFKVTIDERTKEVCDLIKQESHLDIEKLVTNLPDVSHLAKLFRILFFYDNGRLSEMLYDMRDKCYAKGNDFAGYVFFFLGAYLKGFDRCDITLEERGKNVYEFVLDVTFQNGEKLRLNSSAFYNTETGLFYGYNDRGMFNVGYNFNIKEMVVYATVNSWMRNFGFCLGYDLFSYVTPFFFYNTRRFKFDYAGKQWMIQVWKGMYVVSNGAEIGVYNREPKGGTFYNCASDEDMLNIGFSLYHGEELLFTQPESRTWWANGFKLSKELYSARKMTLKYTIEMKDQEMLEAFTRAVDKNIYHDVSYTVDGLKVSMVW